jgi:hypothetical protein
MDCEFFFLNKSNTKNKEIEFCENEKNLSIFVSINKRTNKKVNI